jgi:DNA-binding Lrp family transcriptional regulator
LVRAVLLVNTELGAETQVLNRIKEVEGVEEAHALNSVYDLMVKVKVTSLDKLRDLITYSIRRLAGISSLLTLMIVE